MTLYPEPEKYIRNSKLFLAVTIGCFKRRATFEPKQHKPTIGLAGGLRRTPPGPRRTPPPGPGRPPPGRTLQHTVNERPVRILLECILVCSSSFCSSIRNFFLARRRTKTDTFTFHFSISLFHQMNNFFAYNRHFMFWYIYTCKIGQGDSLS